MALSADVAAHLAQYDARLLSTPEGRRAVTRTDPLAFALIYLPKHLSDADGNISLSETHHEWYRQMQRWVVPPTQPRTDRNAFIAPRAMGKTTTWFLIAPLWAAAHGHVKFAAAFADSATQAETHLATLRQELDTNVLLRRDFPQLVAPMTRQRGTTTFDSRAMIQQSNGFVFAARGVDSASLGLKVGNLRPDLLILDDVESPEASYSVALAEKRLSAITNAILPLNEFARVVWSGTVTMPGSLTDQLVTSISTTQDVPEWITAGNWHAHHHLPILTGDDGTRRSVWPSKWPLTYLESIEHTRDYQLNFLNRPAAVDGDYWSPADFHYGDLDGCTRVILSVDPAVTTKRTSDYTGIAVVGYSPSEKRCVVYHVEQVRLIGAALVAHLAKVLAAFPQITNLLVESNQGGDLWAELFKTLPVPVTERKSTTKKELRAAETVGHYQKGRVKHVKPLPELEAQMTAFPKVTHDDMVDAVGQAVNRLLRPAKPRKQFSMGQASYV